MLISFRVRGAPTCRDRNDISRYVRIILDRPLKNGEPQDPKIKRQFRVHVRDVRQLDETISISHEPAIIVRNGAILVRMDPFRAIVLRDRCLLLVPAGAEAVVDKVVRRLREPRFRLVQLPWEFRTLESILEQRSAMIREELAALDTSGTAAMRELRRKGGLFKVCAGHNEGKGGRREWGSCQRCTYGDGEGD